MEDISQLSNNEIEEKIRALEHSYAEFFADNADINKLHQIRKNILELQKELSNRNDD